MTFAEDIERAADGPILACTIGDMGWCDYRLEDKHQPASARREEVLSWEEARPLLDYEYDSGYGAPDCHAIYAWTETHIVYVSQYDGSTSIYRLPRNPSDEKPEMPGG